MKYTASQYVKVVSSLLPASRTGASAVNGTAADCKGFSEALVVVHAGTFGAGATQDIKLQDSADNSTFADVTGAVFDQITDALDDTVYVGRVDLRKGSADRYLRAVATDAVGAAVSGIEIILLNGYKLPVAQAEDVAFSV